MAVYVDKAKTNYRQMKMCHMIADTHEELLVMVDLIGVQRKWIQFEGTYKEHFDICLAKRTKAIKSGAIEITSKRLVKILLKRKKL